jgi:hypothetical protein
MNGWDDLCGEKTLVAITTDVRHPFDSNANGVALQLDDVSVFAFEDPNDDYRSSCAAPLMAKSALYDWGRSPDYLHAPVLVRRWTKSEYGQTADGIELIDRRNGKTILFLGTDNNDDYYPSYTCDWRPANLADNERTANG